MQQDVVRGERQRAVLQSWSWYVTFQSGDHQSISQVVSTLQNNYEYKRVH